MKKWFGWLAGLAVLAALGWGAWQWLEGCGQMTRIRWLMGATSFLVAGITLLTIRSYKLREKYAVLWLATAGTIFAAACFPGVMDVAREWLGMQYVTAVVAVIFVFLLLVAFHFSIALSALNDKAAATAERTAMLEARLARLEAEARGGGKKGEIGVDGAKGGE
jgi:uncharacterized PurR-regulated membrane protein YhhQ (DUF165 family)